MLIENSIYLISIIIGIISVVLLVSSIKNKEKNVCIANLSISIIYIIYNILVLIIPENYFEIDLGWSLLLIYLLFFSSFIVLIISVIVNIVKISKKQFIYKKANIVFQILCLFIPIIIFLICYFNEFHILSNSNAILKYNYQEGFINSENTIVAVSDNDCHIISDSNLYNKMNQVKLTPISYEIRFNNGIINVSSYQDKYLTNIDLNKVKKIVDDSIKRIDNSNINSDYSNYCADVEKINGSNYYIISNTELHSSYGCGGRSLGEFLYKDTSYHCNINASGNLVKAILVE